MSILLECQEAAFGYEKQLVIKDLSFCISQGDYVCVVGENGSGKSTLIKGLLGLIPVSAGQVLYGDAIADRIIGYLPQQASMQKDFPSTVWEVVLSGCLAGGKKRFFYTGEDKEKAKKQIQRFGLEELLRKRFSELSGGQQQRVLIARALCATERLLILDEPVTGLDPTVTRELYDTLEKLNRVYQTAIVMVTHDVNGALPYAHKVLHIGPEGYFFGSKKEYLNSKQGKSLLGVFREGEKECK